MSEDRPPAGRWGLAPVTLAFAALTLVATYPAAVRLTSHIFGGPWDGPMFLWNVWWAPRALLATGGNPLHTAHFFHPEGTSLVINTHCLAPAILSAPLQALFGLVPAYNLMVMLTFVLSGVGAFLLVREVVEDPMAAFVAGTAFAFGHPRVSMVLFFNLIQTHLLVLFAWALWRCYKRGSLLWAGWAGLAGAVILYTDYNLFCFAAYFGAAWAVFVLVRREDHGALLAKQCAVIIAVILVVGAPLLIQIAAELGSEGGYVTKLGSRHYHKSMPLVRYLLRGPLDDTAAGGGREITEASYLGTVVMLLASLGVVRGWRKPWVRFWLVVAVVFLVVSLGPHLNLSGPSLPGPGEAGWRLPLPFSVIRLVPVLREVTLGFRYALVGWMAVTVLAGAGAKELFGLMRRRDAGERLVALAGVALSVTIFLDFAQIPFPALYRLPDVPRTVTAIRTDPRGIAVLEFPGGRQGNPAFPYYETIHGKPIYLDGHTNRISKRRVETKDASAIVSALRRVYGGEEIPAEEMAGLRSRAVEEMRAAGVGWIVLAWADRETMYGRSTPFAPERLASADRLIRALLPVEEVIGEAGEEEILGWYRLGREERSSRSCVYRSYRLAPGEAATLSK